MFPEWTLWAFAVLAVFPPAFRVVVTIMLWHICVRFLL